MGGLADYGGWLPCAVCYLHCGDAAAAAGHAGEMVRSEGVYSGGDWGLRASVLRVWRTLMHAG